MNREEAFDFLCKLAKTVAAMFGENCETVVQEPQGTEIVTLAIFNGHVSGRKAPTTVGILGGMLKEADRIGPGAKNLVSDDINQLVLHPSGKKIKSSDVVLHGEDYTLIFGINYDVTMMDKVHGLMQEFLSFEGDLYETLSGSKQRTHQNIFDTCAAILPIEGSGKATKSQRHAFMKLLNENGFFSLQKNMPFLAKKLGVSKYTLYKDLAELGLLK